MKGRRPAEGGFSLIELLAVISILGVVSFALTEAVILGFKTTDATVDDVSRSVAVQALQSYFTGDAQSADAVSTEDPAPTCSPVPEGVFLHLAWTDQGRARDVSYALLPDGPAGEVELIRRSWTGCGAPDTKMLGHFSFEPGGPPPVLALCDGTDCGAAAAGPETITIKIPTRRPQEATPASTSTTVAGATTTTVVGTTTTATTLPPGVDLTVRRRTA